VGRSAELPVRFLSPQGRLLYVALPRPDQRAGGTALPIGCESVAHRLVPPFKSNGLA
jgi:hypothetical protein